MEERVERRKASTSAKRAGERAGRIFFTVAASVIVGIVFVGLMYFSKVGIEVVSKFARAVGEYEELSRVTSPDGRLDALFVRNGGGGAMDSFYYRVFVVPAGAPMPDVKNSVLNASDVDRLELDWIDSGNLAIRYREAKIHDFIDQAYPFEGKGDTNSEMIWITESRVSRTTDP